MNPELVNRRQDLEEAFERFSQVSANLASAYQVLENRVSELNAELAQTRSERLRELTEKERLANRLESLLDALPAGVVVLDAQGRVQACNPPARELLGEPLETCAWCDVILRAFAPRQEDGHEVSLRDGRFVSIATSPLRSEPGQIVLLKDVTETRRLQERVNRHQRLSAMGEMAASLAHQIRTPLASVMLYASHLNTPGLAASEYPRVAEKIQARVRHLEHLVSDMLFFAKGGAFGQEQIEIANLLEEVEKILEPQVATQGSSLQISNATQGVLIRGNREALVSALQNLLTNAMQACGTGGQLQLCARSVGDANGLPAVDLLVSDNGPGISAEQQEHIFEPFYTTRPQGTGLGLPVAQAIAQAHQGVLWVKSQTNIGSTFGIRLPAFSSLSAAHGLDSESNHDSHLSWLDETIQERSVS